MQKILIAFICLFIILDLSLLFRANLSDKEIVVPTPSPTITPYIPDSSEPSLTPSYTTYKEDVKVNSEQTNTDLDPIVTCNSKTGALQVRSSICSSHTDCLDGYGGYIFESQDSCKNRWNQISKDLETATKNYGNTVLENQQTYHQYLNSYSSTPIPTVSIDVPTDYKTDINLKIIPATPTPCPQGWYGAELDVSGPCGN